LHEKLRSLPEFAQFRADFEAVTGLHLWFVDELGWEARNGACRSGLCRRLAATGPGRSFCELSRQELLASAAECPGEMRCDAGLVEVAVPIQAAGLRVGYFVFGGMTDRPVTPRVARGVLRALSRRGVEIPAEVAAADLSHAPVVRRCLREAYTRMVSMAASTLALLLTDRLADPGEGMPAAVERACVLLRRSAFTGGIRWPEVAKACGLSEGHLSRLFRHSTGLTFPEYVGRLRAERAKELLERGDCSTTHAAFEAGFQSLSQFHRVFRRVYGRPARDFKTGSPKAAGRRPRRATRSSLQAF
jgi:AraC-like DNA-binding protein